MDTQNKKQQNSYAAARLVINARYAIGRVLPGDRPLQFRRNLLAMRLGYNLNVVVAEGYPHSPSQADLAAAQVYATHNPRHSYSREYCRQL